jgi:hypothetical protein
LDPRKAPFSATFRPFVDDFPRFFWASFFEMALMRANATPKRRKMSNGGSTSLSLRRDSARQIVGAGGSATFDQSNILLNEALSVLHSNGEGNCGGLYAATGGVVTLHKSTVAQNFASTSNSNIYGTMIYE